MARRGSSGAMVWLRGFWARVSIVLFIGISVALLLSQGNLDDPQSFNKIRVAADDVAAPAMQAVDLPLGGLSNFGSWLSSNWNAAERVRVLEAENRALRQWESLSHALHAKILRYEQLLNMQGEPEVRVLSTRVVAEAHGPFVRSALLRIGRDDGVSEGLAVVDPSGLIGRIVSVGKHSARVLLVNDLNSRIPVVFQGASVRAILAGDNQRDPKLIYVGKGFVPKNGDRVSTSGDDGVLPSGISIGEVVEVLNPDGSVGYRVQTYANLSTMDFVQILARQPAVPPELDPISPETGDQSIAILPGAADPSTPVTGELQ
ncbi:MAG: hypothetical protein COA47_09595 [Robiginitomaculum sp.]|nr:MAG: hypothetical protein COA47_09595 [Robiginitomaculum sp.]